MDTERVENFLAHYASKYYDPVKAREYYLRTRELKGREPALSKESRAKQQQATAYVTNEIRTKRQADLDANLKVREELTAAAKARSEEYAARIEKLRGEAEDTREKIAKKFENFIEKIKEDLKIPENASPKLRAFLEKQRARRLNTAMTKVKGELKKIQSDYRFATTSLRDDYRSFREQNSSARRANAAERRTINESYRNDLKSEKQYIKDKVR